MKHTLVFKSSLEVRIKWFYFFKTHSLVNTQDHLLCQQITLKSGLSQAHNFKTRKLQKLHLLFQVTDIPLMKTAHL